MNEILVTGSAGFIGAVTCEKLLKQGKQVVGVDNLNDYYNPKLKEYRLNKLLAYKNFTFYKKDIENFEVLDLLFQYHNFEAVINLAARAGVRYSIENPYIYLSTNIQGTVNLLELMRTYKVKKMVLASSSSLYAGQEMPFTEDLPVNQPISPYAASKKAAEMMAYTYHHLYQLDISILRYFTVYGELGRPDMSVYRFTKWILEEQPIQIYGDGLQSRDFTYVEDIAAGTIKSLKPLGYEIINLGGGQNPVSLKKMIEILESITGKKAKITYQEANQADMKITWADIQKAKKLLDWQPKFSIEQGLERVVNSQTNMPKL